MNSCVKRSKRKGTKSEGQTQTLHNRVRDVFRRGLQWKWDRETGSSFSGQRESHRNGAASKGHETTDSQSQRHWPHFAPVAIQRFRRLFSSDGTNNASCDGQRMDNGAETNDGGLAPCTANIDDIQEQRGVANMVKMKAQDKKSGQKAKATESGWESIPPDTVSSVPSASVESTSHLESINNPSKKPHQDLSLPSAVADISDGKSDNLKSEPSHGQILDEETKASDEHISVNKDGIGDNEPVDCDVDKNESLIVISEHNNDNITVLSLDNNLLLETNNGFFSSGRGSTVTQEIVEENVCEGSADINDVASETVSGKGTNIEDGAKEKAYETIATLNKSISKTNATSKDCVEESVCKLIAQGAELLPSNSIVPNEKDSATPSIVLSTIDAGKTTLKDNEPSKKLLEPLYLHLDSNSTAGNHARKSPVTVQEWVDSIPLSAHLEEDPDHSHSGGELSLAVPELQDIGHVCPSVTLRPASSQSGTGADQRREAFSRDVSPSLQSDTGSHGSSVDSYLDARRPDPEEVLLGLGFGGSVHAAEAEVSRIPSRFLQPSQVKGVAIDDFLRYQQDLIETFESGYSGYRGLTGGAQIPSVIVAKIMEKLREHERDSSIKSSAGSSPGHHADISKRRFSRAAQKITILTKMKSRDSITSGAQAQSVLNPDNRKFLDNQGSKSPEVSRKRMIIGHRSFTFDGDGQLIETETNSEEIIAAEEIVSSKPPLPRPLVHKDSVLSSATSLSLTSYDSDSDTDEASGGERIHGDAGNTKNYRELYRLLSTPVTAATGYLTSSNTMMGTFQEGDGNAFEKRRKSLPSACDLVLNLSDKNERAFNVNNTTILTSTPERGRSWKDLQRVNSAPSISPVCLSTNFPVLRTHAEENSPVSGEPSEENSNSQKCLKQRNQVALENASSKVLGILKARKHCQEKSSISTRQLSFYQISDFVLPGDSCDSPESQSSNSPEKQHLQRHGSMPKSSAMFLDKELRRKLSLNSSSDSHVARSVANTPDIKNWSTSSVSSWESEVYPSKILTDKTLDEDQRSVFEEQSSPPAVKTKECGVTAASHRRRGSLKRQQRVDEEESLFRISSSSKLNVDLSNITKDQGDSFEMEELAAEEEVHGIRTESAHSDSSGFQEETNPKKEVPVRATLGKQLSESEPMLYTQLFPDELVPTHSVEHLKRLSLPVIRVQDETGLTQWRASNICGGNIPFSSSLRRVQSLPSQLSRLGLRRLSESMSPGSISDSIGNMFSSCSDESVIHVPRASVHVTLGPDQSDLLLLPAAISDYEVEVEALCAPRECCKCNCTLKKSLSKCHSELLLSQESSDSFSNVSRGLETLKEAQNHINNIMQQVQNHFCSSSECNMNATLEQVALVVQHQNSLCLQLEHFNSELLSTSRNSSAQTMDSPCSSPKERDKCTLQDVASPLQHSSENCKSLCQLLERENGRLQELVRLNVNELAQVRSLLEKLVSTGKT